MPDLRLLPNLLIIGAAKSGTSALHNYLGEHPQIFMSTPKEPRFFLVWNNPEQWAIHDHENRMEHNTYYTVERYNEVFTNGRNYPVRGESSTAYLANPSCAYKIKELVPDTKIIAVLRNPAERAFSNYVMYKNWGIEKMDFEAAVYEEMKTGRGSYPQPMKYLYLGKYAESLKVYFSLFREEQVRVYLYDDFLVRPAAFLKDIFSFLEVDETFVPDLQKKYNASSVRRYTESPFMDKALHFAERGFRKLKLSFMENSIHRHRFYKPLFKPETRAKLIHYYADEISALEKLLNRDLSFWKM